MKRKSPKPHPNIERARKLPWVTVLCVGERRAGLTERHVENGVRDVLRAAGWWHAPIIAELVGLGRRAEPDTLDLVAVAPTDTDWRWLFWIELKSGGRDLTDGQLRMIKTAPHYGVYVIVCDEASLFADWIKTW